MLLLICKGCEEEGREGGREGVWCCEQCVERGGQVEAEESEGQTKGGGRCRRRRRAGKGGKTCAGIRSPSPIMEPAMGEEE